MRLDFILFVPPGLQVTGCEEVIGAVGTCVPPGLQMWWYEELMIVVMGLAMENSVRLVVTFEGPLQGLTSFGGDNTNTGGPKVDNFLGALEGQDQAETTTWGATCRGPYGDT
jgi:hypothetical protein